MKIAFKIPPPHDDHPDMHLLAEAGQDEVSFLIFSKEEHLLLGFYAYSFNKHINPAEYAATLKELVEKEQGLQKQFKSVSVFYNRKQSTLMPAARFPGADKKSVCDLMFGEDERSVCFSEYIKGMNVEVMYRVPVEIRDAFQSAFPYHRALHSTACGIPANNHDLLRCVVYHNSIKITAVKNNELQLVQYFEYSSPADVCFHLLNVCTQLNMDAATVPLLLSGMIDEHSNLYKEVYKYFGEPAFLPVADGYQVTEKMNEQPEHFYSHLSLLASCV